MADAPDLPPLSSESAPSAEPSNPVAPQPSGPPPAPKGPSGKSRLHALWTLAVRLIVLGMGVSVGWLAGLLVAQVLPSSQPSLPAVEVALRYGNQTRRKLRQLPRWWRDDGTAQLGAAPPERPADVAPAVVPPAVEPAPPAAETEEPALSDADRDRLTADLAGLRQDLANADTRLTELEEALNVTPNGTLADRLGRIDQRLALLNDPEAGSEVPPVAEPETASADASDVARVPYQEPRFPLVRDRVVLPSALLFEPGSSTLTAPGQQLLDSIIPDLRRYGPATLLVGSHTDGAITPDLAGQLTLQQALAVQRFLEPQLEESMTRWVPVGYGKTRPSTVGTTPGEQQRNQRIEIGIVPGS
ncbi:OmpA family protein [Nodosilinea sp. LEGE 07088]|uniref:OmpA family protein n=1 Tax=Nodosilinea sp. LEGE 07088 TaxID=2777968 RepID=UPI001880E615|nr:OmpA family protein [Nodosilinea sp. LEGE 07088]MBE9136699.1 OmpA family protein [Nodosilinea sp. LEGE 07088]